MEIIKEQINITKFKGHCPVCNYEQISTREEHVDRICPECNSKQQKKKICDDLIGATIIDVDYGSGFFHSILVEKGDKEIKIESETSVLSYS